MDWQTLIALIIVLLAASVVMRWGWQALRGQSSGCGSGCHNCPSHKPASPPAGLVELQDQRSNPHKTGQPPRQ